MQMNSHNPSGSIGKNNGKSNDFKKNDYSETQFWFMIRTNDN